AQDFRSFFNMAFPDAADFNGFTLAGADSLNVIAEAVDLAGDMASVADIRDQLAALVGFPGVSGEITYAGTDGTPSDRTIGFFEYVVPADNERGWDKIAKFGIGTGE
ncbi:MAG: ABC transporter substrate-binding protein, partial [Truepera sp.]|nr:ABC transporter substrate-binding protein [Truepera sp.]